MGRKRHITVDVEGSPIVVDVHAASVQDRNGALAVIMALLEVAVCVERLFADSGYAGPKLQGALKELGVSELIEIVPKPKGAKGFTGFVASLGGRANVCVDGSLPPSCKGCGADPGKFSSLGEADRMPLHDATSHSASEPATFCGYRRLMTYGSASYICQAHKPRGIQTLRPERAIERFDESIIRRLSPPRKSRITPFM